MQKHLRARGLMPSDTAQQQYTSYCETLSPDVAFEEIFNPSFWVHHKTKLKRNDIIRLIAHDRSFDIDVTVAKINPSGIVVEYRGGRPPAGADPVKSERDAIARSMKIQIVPLWSDGKPVVRVEHLPKTRWRVLGLEKKEIRRDMETREEAEQAMLKYLEDIRMRMPSEEEIALMRANKAA